MRQLRKQKERMRREKASIRKFGQMLKLKSQTRINQVQEVMV
jgi:hypothetical protein